MGWPFTGDTGLIEKVYLKIYRTKEGEEADRCLKGLLEGTLSQLAFLSAYRDLPPIETMQKKEKLEMYRYVISLFPDKSTPERKVICQVLYTIGTLL